MKRWLAGTSLGLVAAVVAWISTASLPAQARVVPLPNGPAMSMAALPPIARVFSTMATTAATTIPGPVPDAYEPNDTPGQAMRINVGQRLEKLSFWPLDDVDYFAVEVTSDQIGITLTLDTYHMFGLATNLRLRGLDGQLIAENDAAGSTQTGSHLAVALEEAGRYLIEISNQSETRPDYKTYNLETDWQAPGGTPEPDAESTPTAELASTQEPVPTPPRGDAFENNYDFDHAKEIAVGEPITELNFVCPEGDCADNDFYNVMLKGGLCYRFATTDLAPGLDTNLIVYGAERDLAAPLGGNDDVALGEWKSQVDICLPEDPGAITGSILVGNVGNRKPPEPVESRTYTLEVSVIPPVTPTTQPPSATVSPTELWTPTMTVWPTAILEPTATTLPTSPPAPTATPRPTVTPEPSATTRPTATPTKESPTPSMVLLPGDAPLPPEPNDASVLPPVPVEPAPASQAPPDSGVDTKSDALPSINDAPKGLAVVIVATTELHVAPGARTEIIQSITLDKHVKLFGQARGAWVRVQPFDSVVPGWVYAADLRPLPGTISGGPVISDTLALSTTASLQSTPTLLPATPPMTATITSRPTVVSSVATAIVEALPDSGAAEAAAPVLPRAPVEITVEVREATGAPVRRGAPAPTSGNIAGVDGMRVQVVTVFGDVLVEAITPADGRVTFRRDVPPDTALFVQLPALGLRRPLPIEDVAAGKAQVVIAVPQ